MGVINIEDAKMKCDYAKVCGERDKLLKFKQYFDSLYGENLEVANWHLNGELEPFDNFYEDALNCMEATMEEDRG